MVPRVAECTNMDLLKKQACSSPSTGSWEQRNWGGQHLIHAQVAQMTLC